MFWPPGPGAQCAGSSLWGPLVPSKAQVEFHRQLRDLETFKCAKPVVSGSICPEYGVEHFQL